ncbi:uncharacterized protein PGTG_13947 [Puccinia graminis f. sp. tritici CRL 75-36-700-3]|uniref:C3H1-type domain-containing protein n=1 Tax=Puccinia graminis f. sp. tritici (strain CRL 75-36-700-3 / race SCCL) TaxID=418459 RepID=E3KTF1_PUCGT|nr:uncharacterized protein PGTG_13947 [Puccinia graminis f. sp. tritici CRL 75-36-700-3]EFP87576.2 hypothetical protein PGTG_13947 [Puccinia graminis f. sp. tritici CRL 75-36-700-3]
MDSSTMLVSPNPSVQAVQLPSSAELDPADPIWRHVKTEWDHHFVKRGNFLPWLRAQLQIDPIDEACLAPEPLLCYVKRRLALAQSEQRLRAAANHGQPAPAAASHSTPSNGASNMNGAFLEPTPASSLATRDSCPGNSSNSSRSGPFVSPQSDGVAAPGPASQLFDRSASDASRASSNQLLNKTHVSSSSISFSGQSPSSMGQGNAFSSQLGAIADAHMGNSSHVTPISSSSTSNSQTNAFPFSSSGLDAPHPYLQADVQAHQYPHSQVLFTRQENGESNQQQHSSQLSLFPSSTTSSTYVNHPAQSSPALAFAATHSHPLQPQNANQYSHPLQPTKITQYEQFPHTHKKNFEPQTNAFAHNNQSLDFNGSLPISESGNWNTRPLAQIDPALMAGHETSHVITSQTQNQSVAPITPAIDITPRVTAPQSMDAPSPRRTRSAAALTKKAASPATSSRTPVSEKAPPKKGAPRTANPSVQDNSVESIPNPSANNSPQTKERNSKDQPNSSSNSSSITPADQYNRKAWKSRLSTIRTELDHITKAPARSANKLVKILTMYSISPTPNSGDWSTVPPEGRIEVLSAIKAAAPLDFYNTWVSESKGLSMLEAWLKGSVHAQERAKSKDTSGGKGADEEALQRETLLTHLLQTLEKLPLTIENLKNHTFPKQVMRINKEQNANRFSEGVKRLSLTLEQKWRAICRGVAAPMLRNGSTDSVNNPAASTSETKKRTEAPADSNQSKKRKVETTRIAITATPSAGKSTNDLFGRPDKAKLPAFTKKATEPTPAPTVVVQDSFAQAMGLLKGKNSTGTFTETAPSTSTSLSNAAGKLAKRVRFVADNELCQIKIVERLVYEGEEYETHPVGDARKMDAVEGRYLHQSDSFLEEEIEWETPLEVILTSETISNLETSPLVSAELAAQEEREKAVPGVTYEDESQIPHTPHEPGDSELWTVGDTGSTGLPKVMKLGGNLLLDPEVSHLIAKAQADNSVDAPVAPDHTVSDLLARLGGGGVALSELSNQTSPVTTPYPSGFDATLPPGLDMNLLNSISQSGSLQALLAASGGLNLSTQPVVTTHVTDTFPTTIRDNGWGAAAGSASRGREKMDAPEPYIPTGPSAGVSRNKRRKKGKDGNQPRISAHDSYGRHIKCKWWPNCPHGNKCFYKHG